MSIELLRNTAHSNVRCHSRLDQVSLLASMAFWLAAVRWNPADPVSPDGKSLSHRYPDPVVYASALDPIGISVGRWSIQFEKDSGGGAVGIQTRNSSGVLFLRNGNVISTYTREGSGRVTQERCDPVDPFTSAGAIVTITVDLQNGSIYVRSGTGPNKRVQIAQFLNGESCPIYLSDMETVEYRPALWITNSDARLID
jgi:hypothetical protein